KHFEAVIRTVGAIIPSIETLDVVLDQRRGTLDLFVRQAGIDYSSRVVSEGTLRVIGLCAIAVNPWSGSLLAFEEPENGVHPRRLETIAQLLTAVSLEQGRQVIVATHSPLFCNAVIKEGWQRSNEDVALFNVRRQGSATTIERFEPRAPLFLEQEVGEALDHAGDDLFGALVLRGLIDE
ncbi:MAG: ATP-binding protein, partial [Chloroflexota bacterium]|nr:ATP-binding protein [Chloroflexota bacterium]